MVEVASSVSLEGVVADEFNADEDMKDAFAQSIIDSSDGVFDDVVDVEAVVRRRRLQAEYPPSPAPTREADRTLAPTRAAAGLADVSYTGVARRRHRGRRGGLDGFIGEGRGRLTTAVDDGSFLDQASDQRRGTLARSRRRVQRHHPRRDGDAAHIGRARHVFVVTTPEPTAAPTPRPTPGRP